MRPARLSLPMVLAVLCATAHADSLTYQNSRFGTRATFPADLFEAIDPAPTNGDGRYFRTVDGAELAIYGQFNALEQTPETMVSQARGNAAGSTVEITYTASGADWVVISGIDGGTVFYERHEFGTDDVIHSMVLRYPRDEKPAYDATVGAVADSLEGP